MNMPGIQFVINDEGDKTAVLIDLQQHADLWEDFYDCYHANLARDEPTIPIEQLKRELDQDSA